MSDLLATCMSNDAGFVKNTLAECHHFHTIVQAYCKILHQLVVTCLPSGYVYVF